MEGATSVADIEKIVYGILVALLFGGIGLGGFYLKVKAYQDKKEKEVWDAIKAKAAKADFTAHTTDQKESVQRIYSKMDKKNDQLHARINKFEDKHEKFQGDMYKELMEIWKDKAKSNERKS